MKRVKAFLKQEIVLVAAALAAGTSLLFVPPSANSIQCIDFRVLTLLFCLMAVVAGLQKIGVFASLGQHMVTGAQNTRLLCMALVMLCFFSSMLITNDVALITFVPFAILILTLTGQKNFIYVISLQTVAANLGSMLTPVGNPQNLYLYTSFSMTPLAFFRLTLPVTGVSFVLLLLLCLAVKPEHIEVHFTRDVVIGDRRRLFTYLALFALCLICVLKCIPYPLLLAVTVGVLLFADRTLLLKVDYGLLATFVCFFVFVGNIEHIEPIRQFIAEFIRGREQLAAIALSQVISNVPAAVLLSGFTDKGGELVLGTDIGGLGTLVASLASLISFKLYAKSDGAQPGRYFGVFTAVNAAMLLVLMLIFTVL